MSSISPEDRRLIDEAVAEGRITIYPPGRSGVDSEELLWNPKTNKLEFTDKAAALKRAKSSTRAIWGSRRTRLPSPEIAARRAKVADLIQSGKPAAFIAEQIGVSVATIYSDARNLKMNLPRVRSGGATSRYDPLKDKHRDLVAAAFDGKRTVAEIAEMTRINGRTVADHLEALGLEAPAGKPGPKSDTPRVVAAAERREKVRQLADEGHNGTEIAEILKSNRSTIHLDCRVLGIKLPRKRRSKKAAKPKRSRRANAGDVAAVRKEVAAAKKVAVVRDRRRFKTVPVPMGDPAVMAPQGATGTIFPSRVFEPGEAEALLKDGSNQSKIGGDVLVGWLKGASIYTLTLEERATCPSTCRHWLSCYGNSMPHSRRWRHGPELMARLEDEIAALCARHERVLIRLHVLGDFWSIAYADLWGRMLDRHANLFVFGFTAHRQGTGIGDFIAAIRNLHPRRFWMRHSDVTGPWGSFTVDFPTEQKTIGDAVVCPEQRDGMSGARKGTHCGNCGVCWSSSVPVAFITH